MYFHYFQIELQIMARLQHPNIVQVFGGCLTPPNLFVVAELMSGDLSDRIHPYRDRGEFDRTSLGATSRSLTLRQALLFALDIIRGLVGDRVM